MSRYARYELANRAFLIQHRRHQRLQICQRVARRNQHYDRDIERRQILLVLQFPIDCQKDVEVPLSKAQ